MSTVHNGATDFASSTKTILFADNDADFLSTRSEFAENAGYHVIKAGSLSEAKRSLSDDRVHVAVLDLRLLDDEDEKDLSGLMLAQDPQYRTIPKIILTSYATIESTRAALRQQQGEPAPAVDYLSKEEGPDMLLDAIGRTFEHHVPLNWQLSIDWKALDPRSLANQLRFDVRDKQLTIRATELADLLRHLFTKHSHIRVESVLWQRPECIAFSVFAFMESATPDSFIVLCGTNPTMASIKDRYYQYAPKAAGDNSSTLVNHVETMHFAAQTYSLAGFDLENTKSLIALFHSAPEKQISAALTTLFESTLSEWHQVRRATNEAQSISHAYRTRLDLAIDANTRKSFEERLRELARLAPTLGHRIDIDSDTLTLHFPNKTYAYPNPTAFVFDETEPNSHSAAFATTPGTLTGDNVLVSTTTGRVWLTDFAHASWAPALWNFVAIEASIRFDWIDERNLMHIHDLERTLNTGSFTKFYLGDLERDLQKPVRVIQTIRSLAARSVGKQTAAYHLGILYQAIARIMLFDLSQPLTQNELARLLHALLTSVIAVANLGQTSASNSSLGATKKGLSIDENSMVWIDERYIEVRGQSFDLLLHLYRNTGKLCTRQNLIEQVFNETFDAKNRYQISRLNTAIRRLRKLIELDPNQPVYLRTIPGKGYILTPQA